MRKTILFASILFFACNKSPEQVNVSQQQFHSGTFVQPGDSLNSVAAVKGTLQAGSTYYLSSVNGDAVINAGDTLVIQSGVTIYAVGSTLGTQDHSPGIVVNGTLL